MGARPSVDFATHGFAEVAAVSVGGILTRISVHSSSVIRVSSSKGPLVKILAEIEVSINT